MQAIVTKYHGPTDHNGSRITARADAGRISVSWDYALNDEQNHDAAALALAVKLGWAVDLVGGGLPTRDGNAYVMVKTYNKSGLARVLDRGGKPARPPLTARVDVPESLAQLPE